MEWLLKGNGIHKENKLCHVEGALRSFGSRISGRIQLTQTEKILLCCLADSFIVRHCQLDAL